MAIGVVRLTRRGRFILSITFICFLLAQSLLGVYITSWSVYICIVISPSLYSENSEVTFVFTITGMYGTHVLFHNLVGIKICQKSYKEAHKKSTRNLLFLWTVAGYNTLINILILSSMGKKISKHIERSLRNTMEKAIHNYLKDASLKRTIDSMQVKLQCCGVDNYKDWYTSTWIDQYHVNVEDNLITDLRLSKDRLHLPITPWSCCRIDFPLQCFHDPLQQPESVYLWKEQSSTVVDSIYERGCLTILTKPIENALTGLKIIVIFIFLLQTITVVLSRYLYTSCRNALILDGVEGIAPGWLFGRGDCGWARGPGLLDLMEGVEQKKAITTTTSSNDKKTNRSSDFQFPRQPPKIYFAKDRSCKCRSDEEPVSSEDEAALMLN